MLQLLQDIRHNRLLWLLVFVPAVFVAQAVDADAHTRLFVLSVLAIVISGIILVAAARDDGGQGGDLLFLRRVGLQAASDNGFGIEL